MQNSSAFEIRRRAQRWLTHQDAQTVMDNMFRLLLSRLIKSDDESLEIIIESPDPMFLNPDMHKDDRVYIVDVNDSSNRMGVRATRLLPNVLLICYALHQEAVRPRGFGGPPRSIAPTASELAKLKADAKNLMVGASLMSVFQVVAKQKNGKSPTHGLDDGQPWGGH